MITDGLRSDKTKELLNLIKHQWSHSDKTYLHDKDPFTSKCYLLIKGRIKVEIMKTKYRKSFIIYSQTIDDLYEKFENENLTRKALIVCGDLITDMEACIKLNLIVTELF